MAEPHTEPVLFTSLVLKCRHIERVRGFYEALGIRFDQEQHGTGPVHYAGQLGEVVFELYPLENESPADSSRLGFAVENLEKVLFALNETGAVVVSQARQTPWGRQAVVRDPDGRAVELYQR